MNRESGVGGFKAILAVALFAALIFLGIKLLPPFINNYQFQEDLATIARLTTYAQNKGPEEIRADVMVKVKELGLPVKEEQVTVSRNTYGVNIEVKYTVHVEVPGHTFKINFNPAAGNKMLTAKD